LNKSLPEVDVSSSDFGRITQGATKHLLSLVYLTRGYKTFASSTDFAKSAQLAEEVISNGNYTLLSSFADVFKADNQKIKKLFSLFNTMQAV